MSRSFIVVYTTEDKEQNSVDDYKVCESMEEARVIYTQLLEREDVTIATITGVIDSTDYEPYEFPNDSEKQLEEFLDHLDEERGFRLELHGQGMETMIDDKKEIYLCVVKADKYGKLDPEDMPYNKYLFGGISEAFFNKMVGKFTKREDPEWDRDEVVAGVEDLLVQKWVLLGIDVPLNHDEIRKFIVDDIIETADPLEWHSGDFDIAFRRWVEAQSGY